MLRILNSTLVILFFATNALALTCESGKIRSFTDFQEKVTESEYCYNSDFNELYSKSCENQKCSAFESQQVFVAKDLKTHGFGTPGFKLCRLLNGKPEIIDFWANEEWQHLDRCNFEDGYVDTGALYKFYLKP
ncbi:MAG: hypothetical protein ACM3MG_09040 [Bacillota bacterium]